MSNRKTTPTPPRKVYSPGTPITQQHFKEEVDINNIIARFKRTGNLPPGVENQYGDISSMDFLEMQNAVVAMKVRFGSLPAKTRDKFMNSPEAMLRFIEDPDNHTEARKLGLLPPEPSKAPEPPKPLQNAPEAP